MLTGQEDVSEDKCQPDIYLEGEETNRSPDKTSNTQEEIRKLAASLVVPEESSYQQQTTRYPLRHSKLKNFFVYLLNRKDGLGLFLNFIFFSL